jgi:hypothetical protein
LVHHVATGRVVAVFVVAIFVVAVFVVAGRRHNCRGLRRSPFVVIVDACSGFSSVVQLTRCASAA